MASTRYDAGALQREAQSAATADSRRRFGKPAVHVSWELEMVTPGGHAHALVVRLVVNYAVRGEGGDVAAVTVAL